MKTGIIVPIDVKALCVGKEQNTQFLHAPYDFTRLPWQNHYDAQLSSRIAAGTLKPLGSGIHLHWALPDALTKGTDSDKAVTFPPVPNRWLVTRLYTTQAYNQIISTHSWVIESNYMTRESSDPRPNHRDSVSIPYDTKDPKEQPYRFLGRACEAASWQEAEEQSSSGDSSYLPQLTCVGFGDPEFAAFYPNCYSVFGFYDTLEDLSADLGDLTDSYLSYQVTGWYSLKENDIAFRRSTPNQTFWEETNWCLPSNSVPSYPSPDGTLYSGIISDIMWNSSMDYEVKLGDDIIVSMGYSPNQAMSALIKEQVSVQHEHEPGLELILDALQLDLLSKHAETDWEEKLEAAIHASTFNSYQGGTIWTVKETSSSDENNTNLTKAPTYSIEDLNQLNLYQQSYDTSTNNLESQKWQIFSDWHRFMEAKYPLPGEQSILEISDTATYIKSEINALIIQYYQQLQGLSIKIEQLKNNIKASLGNSFQLLPTGGPRYFKPSDPALLLYGKSIQPCQRYGKDGRYDKDGKLLCRLPSQIVTSLTIKSEVFQTTTDLLLASAELSALLSPYLPFPDIMHNLIGEAILLSPYLTAALLKNKGVNTKTSLVVQKLKKATDDYIQSSLSLKIFFKNTENTTSDNKIFFSGTAPSPVAVCTWENLWLPFSLRWQIDYYPLKSSDVYDSNFILNTFQLENLDFSPQKSQLNTFQTYSGSIFLTPGVQDNLNEQILNYIKVLPSDEYDDEFKELGQQMKNLPALSQVLLGFVDALMMRSMTMQLEVGDPIEKNRGYYDFSNKAVKNTLGNEGINMSAPAPFNFFHPIGGGLLNLREVTIVDVFGQLKKITPDPAKVIRAFNMKQTSLRPLNFIYLPPRIAQPSRLLFRWISSSTSTPVESNESLTSSPICGWVMCNHLDKSLMFYDSDGTPLGSLILNEYNNSILWQNAPGGHYFNEPIEEALTYVNSHLRAMILSLYQSRSDYLNNFMNSIDSALTLIDPPGEYQNINHSFLIGSRPVAVVRAALTLELMGLPAYNQSFNKLKAEVDQFMIEHPLCPAPKDENNFTNVKFPVYLGHTNRRDDGLIGYFIEDNYNTFYCDTNDGACQQIITPVQDTLTLCPRSATETDPPRNDLSLTLLIDHRNKVHATTGIVPQKYIELPPLYYNNITQKLKLTFMAGPILQSCQGLRIPSPFEASNQWSWVENQKMKWSELTDIKNTSTEARLNYSPQIIKEGWLKLLNNTD